MSITRISREQFENYQVDKAPTFVAKERAWFADVQANLLGIILEDNFDKDWGFVVLALEEDGWYRAIGVEVSFDTESIAREKIFESMSSLSRAGQKSESFYEASDLNFEPYRPVIGTIDDEVKRYFKKYPERLYRLDPRKFEELIASIMEDLGFTVELTRATRDGGADIIARIKTAVTDFVANIECKRYSPENKVNVSIVRSVIGVHNIKNPSKSIIVTTSFFTKDAIKEARQYNHSLELKDFNNLKELLQGY